MTELTHQQKIDKFKVGLYKYEIPPVPTTNWTINDWIKWNSQMSLYGKIRDKNPPNPNEEHFKDTATQFREADYLR